MNFFRSRIFAACIASTVTAIVVGGISWAAIPNTTTGAITACYPTSGASKGALRVIDYQAGQRCVSGEATLQWQRNVLRWRGPWTVTASYAANDAVLFNGSAYLAKRTSVGIAPTNTTSWSLMVSKGSPGSRGSTGPTGAGGPAGPQGATGSQGATGLSPALSLVTGNQQITTTATSWSDVPGATAMVSVASPQTTLIVQLSGVTGCATTGTPDSDTCTMRVLVDGQPTEPQVDPSVGYMVNRVGPYCCEGGSGSIRASAVVGSGSHTVTVQWEVQDVAPLNSGTTWYLNFWTLSVEQFT
jgi:hypothetical protein